jgi:hypothetical protein
MSAQLGQLRPTSWKWIAALGGAGLAGLLLIALAIAGYMRLQQMRQEEASWAQVRLLAQQQSFDNCIRSSAAFGAESRFYGEAQALMQQCRVGQAQRLASQGSQLGDALSLLALVPSQSKSYGQARTLMQNWSKDLKVQAEAQFKAGQLDRAIAILRQTPAQSPEAQAVEPTIQGWQREWSKNATAIKTAESDLKRGRWLAAKQSLDNVTPIKYWQDKAKPLMQRAEAGIAEVARYEEAEAARQIEQQRAARSYQAPPEVPYSGGGSESGGGYYAPPPEPAANSGYVPAEPSYRAPAAPAPAPAFQGRVEEIYRDYSRQGQSDVDAWSQACESAGGQVVDNGPEVVCQP